MFLNLGLSYEIKRKKVVNLESMVVDYTID